MHIISWNKELETGIESIDSQHMQFLKKANKFVIKFLADKKSEAAIEELEFLKDYLLYHFQIEETFQFDSDYPGYLDHQAEHKFLAFRIKEMAIALQESDSENGEEALARFADFINEWVYGHILNLDLEFAKYYRSWKTEKNSLP